METMTARELRQRRQAAGLSQRDLAEAIGLSRDFIGLMERGERKVTSRTAMAVRQVCPDLGLEGRPPISRSKDPVELIVEDALIDAGIPFVTDHGGANPSGLDFYLPKHGIAIEVKRFHSPRIAEQMSRAPHVIAIQGLQAATLFARLIRAGGSSLQ